MLGYMSKQARTLHMSFIFESDSQNIGKQIKNNNTAHNTVFAVTTYRLGVNTRIPLVKGE